MQSPTPNEIILLLLVASIVSIGARRLKLPASAGLLLAGLLLAVLDHLGHFGAQIELTNPILFTALLPALVFEGAINIRAADLRADWLPLLVLVTLGVIINLAVAAVLMHFILHWPWLTACLFGAAIAATDPIAVLSTFKSASIGGRTAFLAEAESLLNDGVAMAAVGLVLLAGSTSLSPQSLIPEVGINLIWAVLGGAGIGVVVGMAMTQLIGRSKEPLVETTLTFIAAYGAYYIADTFHASSILAAVSSGLVLGNVGVLSQKYISPRGRESVEALWDFAAFIANALVFLLMGFNLAHVDLRAALAPALAGIVVGVVARAAAVYLCGAILSGSSRCISMPLQHILVWGGQRGALSLMLAVSVEAAAGKDHALVEATVGLVAFSILAQGLSFNPLLRALQRRTPPEVWN